MKIAIFCPNVYTCTHLPRGPLCNNSQFISKTVVTQSCQMTRLVTVIRPSHTSKTRVFRAHCHWTSNLQIQPPTETRTENYQPMLKKSLFFALGFCFVLLEAEVNVFLCDLSLHRRLMKVNFVLGFGIAITNSRGFKRWKACSFFLLPSATTQLRERNDQCRLWLAFQATNVVGKYHRTFNLHFLQGRQT